MDFFLTDEYIDEVLKIYYSIRHDGYYVKMAVAWALSVCFVKYPEKTMRYLETPGLDDWTYNKTLQKIVESYRVDDRTKSVIRSMKRKGK
jgi:3-methyladenine DNA glycosylase AlkD